MKLIRVADLRDIHDQYLREEITFSRYSELLNERAAENLKKIDQTHNEAMDILRELVELKRMSELIKERAQAFIAARDNGDTSDLEDEHLIALKEEYNRRKPIAWQRAKDLLLTQ